MSSIVSLSATWDVLTTPTQLAEGVLWGGWAVSSIGDVYKILYKKGEEIKKTQGVWEARKALFYSECVSLSCASMVLSWLNRVQIISLGSILPFTDILGYGGSAILSGKRLLLEIKGLFSFESNPKEKSFALGYLNKILKVIFNALLTTWGVLYIFALSGIKTIASEASLNRLLLIALLFAVLYCLIFIRNQKPEALSSKEKLPLSQSG